MDEKQIGMIPEVTPELTAFMEKKAEELQEILDISRRLQRMGAPVPELTRAIEGTIKAGDDLLSVLRRRGSK